MSPDQVVVLEDPIASWPSSVGSLSSAGHPLGNFEGCQPLPRCELLARVVFVSRACSSRYSCSGRSMAAWVKQQCLLPVDTRAVFAGRSRWDLAYGLLRCTSGISGIGCSSCLSGGGGISSGIGL